MLVCNIIKISLLIFAAGAPFPMNFRDVVKTIFKRLFRVYAHIYHSHFQKIVSLKEEAHLNTCFKHFILFTHVLHLLYSYPFTLYYEKSLTTFVHSGAFCSVSTFDLFYFLFSISFCNLAKEVPRVSTVCEL